MKTLLVLRHAKSSWKNVHLSDYERPLNSRGKVDAPRMGKLLRQEDLVPDLIISSSAERALATAEAAALASGYENEIKATRRLYLAGPVTYLTVLQKMGEAHERVMIVGHNPGMEDLVALFTGVEEYMSTAALAQINLPITRWSELTEETKGRLVNIWRPKELP